MNKTKKPWRLSPSSIGEFNRCPRCFYIDKQLGIPTPRGIFPSLPGGIDRVMKKFMDKCRFTGDLPYANIQDCPDWLKLYQNSENLEHWRNWRTGLTAKLDDAILIGAIDDLLIGKNVHWVFDYKTKGAQPKEGEWVKYYQHQLDLYAVLLSKNGLMVGDKAFLLYMWPTYVSEVFNQTLMNVLFSLRMIEMDISLTRGIELMKKAIACLNGALPNPAPACEYCQSAHDKSIKNIAEISAEFKGGSIK